jgi:peptide chain release factor 1
MKLAATAGRNTKSDTTEYIPQRSPPKTEVVLGERDIEVRFCRGSGAGGQNRNKRDTVAVITHVATGIVVRAESERSQHANRESAMTLLRAKLWDQARGKAMQARGANRKAQVGCGARGDKRRTLQVRHDVVVDHVTGRKWRYKDYERGIWLTPATTGSHGVRSAD